MTIDLYYFKPSMPCRSVMLTAEAIGLSLNLITVDLFKGEHLTSEYEEMNPLKNIPLLVDGDYKLSESRAIMCYLVDQYAKDDKFYPKAPKERALVNQKLYFDLETLNKSILDCYQPVLWGKRDTYEEAKHEKVKDAFKMFNRMLFNQTKTLKSDYSVGRTMTIADFCLITTCTAAEVSGFDLSPYKSVKKWMEKVKSNAPGYKQINNEGFEMLRQAAQSKKRKQEESEDHIEEA